MSDIVLANYDFGVKMVKPLYQALVKAGYKPASPSTYRLAALLAAFLNSNRVLTQNFLGGKSISVFGSNLYASRDVTCSVENALSYKPEFDFRKYVGLFSSRLVNGATLIDALKNNNTWSIRHMGRKDMPAPLVYLFTAASISGDIVLGKDKASNKMTFKKIISCIDNETSRNKVFDALLSYNTSSEASDRALFNLFIGAK